MERKIQSFTKELKESRLLIPAEGILLHGTSFNRAEGIKIHGFKPSLANGDTLDPFSSHFFYFNPDPLFIRKDLFWIMRWNVNSLIDYAQWASRNDIYEGVDNPAIILLRKPKDFSIAEDAKDRAKRVPVMVSTHKHVSQKSIIDVINIGEKISPYQRITRREEHFAMEKIWRSLSTITQISEPQSPDQG